MILRALERVLQKCNVYSRSYHQYDLQVGVEFFITRSLTFSRTLGLLKCLRKRYECSTKMMGHDSHAHDYSLLIVMHVQYSLGKSRFQFLAESNSTEVLNTLNRAIPIYKVLPYFVIKILQIKKRDGIKSKETRPGWGEAHKAYIGTTEGF